MRSFFRRNGLSQREKPCLNIGEHCRRHRILRHTGFSGQTAVFPVDRSSGKAGCRDQQTGKLTAPNEPGGSGEQATPERTKSVAVWGTEDNIRRRNSVTQHCKDSAHVTSQTVSGRRTSRHFCHRWPRMFQGSHFGDPGRRRFAKRRPVRVDSADSGKLGRTPVSTNAWCSE
jgi:hypothetical protein